MRAIESLLTGQPFLFGVLFAAVGAVIALWLRRREPDWGLIWAPAVVLATIAAGVARFGAFEQRVAGRTWVYPLAVVAAGAAVFGILRIKNPLLGAWATAFSLAGIWATVPDTEIISVQLGVTAMLIWVWHPAGWAKPRVVGAGLFAVLAAWAIIVGGMGRITGAIGGLGALASLGWTALWVPTSRPWIWMATHLVAVILWSRWAGLMSRGPVAVVVGLVISATVAVVGYIVRRQDGKSEAALAKV